MQDSIIIRGVQKHESIEKFRVSRNFENPAIRLQWCTAAYKICKYTVQFLVPVKLLETLFLRIVCPEVNERVTACLVLDIMYAVEQYRWGIREVQTYISKSVWIQ